MKILFPIGALSIILCSCMIFAPPAEEEPPEQLVEVFEEPEILQIEPQPEPEVEEFVVTEEVYSKTFDEIEVFIRNLSEIIRNEDYDTWLMYLSEDYIERTGDPEYLKQQSEQPLLKKSNVHLSGLRDYFTYVVVPSRTQAKLDEIEFIDETQVRAFAMIKSTKALLYLLVSENGDWKIGVW